MQEALAQLTAALRERIEIIGDERSRRDPEKHTARLQVISERIEALERLLPASTHPQLRHFLQRRSYSKALEFIETQ